MFNIITIIKWMLNIITCKNVSRMLGNFIYELKHLHKFLLQNSNKHLFNWFLDGQWIFIDRINEWISLKWMNKFEMNE